MNSRGIKLITIGLFLVLYLMLVNENIINFNKRTLWETVYFTILVSLNLGFPVIFFSGSFFMKFPFNGIIKLILIILSLYIIISGAIMIGGIGMMRKVHTTKITYSIYYISTTSLIFSLWLLLLATPLSKYKFLNWPFEQRKENNID